MTPRDLQERTHRFALDVLRSLEARPVSRVPEWRRQLVRSAASVGANYRAACRAQSLSDFIAKMKLVEEEADESQYWLELLGEMKDLEASAAGRLAAEASQLVAIAVASIKTARARRARGD
jgi:four helix bundle protein